MRLSPSFWRFWLATVLVNLGDGIRLAAFPLLAVTVTDDPFLVAVVAAAGMLPWLVVGLPAGALADRRGTRALLVGADCARLAVLALLVVAVALDAVTVAALAAGAFVLGAGETLRDTAAQTAVPRLVPAALLERANGRLVAGEVVGNEFVGPLLGGVLFGLGAALPFVTNGGLVALSVLLVVSVPAALLVRPAPAAGEAAAPRGLREGARWLRGRRTLGALAGTVTLVALADSAWFAVFVLYVEDRMGLGPGGFGALLACGAVGGLGGALGAERIVGRSRHRSVVAGSSLLAGALPCLLLVTDALWAAIVVTAGTSAAFGVLNVAAVSMRHRMVPAAVLGRVTATWRTFVLGAGALGALVGGALMSAAGVEAAFLLSGVLAVLATVAWLAWSRPAHGGPLPA